MKAWVYHGRTNRARASELVEQLRAEARFELVIPANSARYGGEIHRGDVIFHDGTRRDLVWANEREGVECRQFAGSEMASEVAPPVVDDAPAQDPQEAESGAGGVESFTGVRETSPGWFKAFRDDEQVGSSQRTEAEAWALLQDGP